ncbi:4'-phosphopantetheinyl transferase family protein [Lysobacter yangpyeongensis]|uniref:4'-phosphopantetheinyl transferase family protein n=1 Tax=Lysobacter yangpyeongensis TaxID=346182 RepID=A0ABW0SJ67_9GAMM
MLQVNLNRGPTGPHFPGMALREAFDSALPRPNWLTALSGVRVALFDLHDWWPWLADAYAMLDSAELRRVQSRRVASDQDQLALGYSLHRLLLGKALDCDAADVPIGRDASGCPHLADSPLRTSLSHAEHCVAAAVAPRGAIGVDIELAARAPVIPEIAERVCHPADAVGMSALPGVSRSEALLALWVRKEAFLKAAGIGLQREMQTFAAPDNGLLALPDGSMTRVRMLEADPQWVVAVASAPDVPVTCAVLHPLPDE